MMEKAVFYPELLADLDFMCFLAAIWLSAVQSTATRAKSRILHLNDAAP